MKFEVVHNVELPVLKRAATTKTHAFPWDAMKPGSMFPVPLSYWTTEMERPDVTPAKAREAIRRHFYNWQAEKDAEKRLRILFEDFKDDAGEYAGVRVYLTTASGAADPEKETPEAEDKVPATALPGKKTTASKKASSPAA